MIKKKSLVFFIKALISISLLTIIIINVDWNAAFKNLGNANFTLLAVAFLLTIVERSEVVYKWNLLIKARGIDVTFNRLFLINLIGSFWGLFIPSSLGTDIARGYYLAKNNAEKSVSVSSVFVDRILGTFSIALFALVSVTFAGDLIYKMNIKIYVYLFFIFLVAFFYLFQREEPAKFLVKNLEKIRYRKLAEIFSKLHISILEYKKYPKTILLSFFFTILAHVTRVMIFYFVALSFNISVPLIYFFLFVPLVTLIIMVPISIGGLGVGEGAFVAFFMLAGISFDNCLVMAFTNTIINTFFTLFGGVVYLFYNNPREERKVNDK
jgi:hypothetical protein